MRIISYNVNGIRAAINKGFTDWLATDPADIICLQEIKALQTDVDMAIFEALGYNVYWCPAQKKGYSGVAILSKFPATNVHYGMGAEQSDAEGRVIGIDMYGVRIISAYFPSGTTGDIRQTYKYQWLDEFYDYIQSLMNAGIQPIVCGDYNICHKAIDIHNPVSNKNTSGFLPEERAWMDKWFENKMVDTFRYVNAEPHHYSWWSYRANARAQNKGWRIDYISVHESMQDKIVDARIYPNVVHSDHCPVYAELNGIV